MKIGIVKEILKGEKRVAAVPDTVKKIIADGNEVFIEKDAGVNSFFENEEYLKAGATILDSSVEVFEVSDLILKVKEPQFSVKHNMHEIDMMKEGQTLITFLHPASPNNHEMIKNLAQKGVVALTLDGIPRISRAQSMDALSSMSTCAGYKGMVMAIDAIPKFLPLIGSAVGMIPPANVLVIGTGVAGLRALATARGLGARVYSVDLRADANEQAKSLGAEVIDLEIPEKFAVSKDKLYAKQLPEKWLEREKELLRPYIEKADIVYLSALVFGEVAPIIIDDAMIKLMKRGSCIVDVAIDQGGNCSETVAGERTELHGVIIEGSKNIPGMIPASSTFMFANNVYNLVKYLVKDGKMKLDLKDEITSSILVTIDKKIVHKGTLEAMKG